MTFQLNLPPSMVSRMAKDEDAEETMGKPKREDWKKLKELEEARKAGTAPAMKDEEGKDINPHIPQYIMQAPWYYGQLEPTLKHQRIQGEQKEDVSRFEKWFKKGVKTGPVATKYRKGACENCGAMTHKKRDCLERPRKFGAKYTGEEIAPDEHVNEQLEFDYDGKRDRWNGYDTTEHSRIIEEYTKIDEAKRQLKSNKMDMAARELRESRDEEPTAGDSEDEEDEDKYADHVDMPGQKFETKQRITVRNLRIREDMAKYLYNLDPNSAYYDPKTRSMRDNPFSNTGKTNEEVTFAGDNFVRWSGSAHKMAEQQLFAWEAYEKGQEAHLQADPTKLELLNKEFNRKKELYKDEQKQSILDKYGGEEHLDAPHKELLMAQSDHYVEYSRTGSVLKGVEKAKIKSRYEEDVYINNHTSIWGSFWKEGRWGYQCCHSLIKESYCVGRAGKVASGSVMDELMGNEDTLSSQTKQRNPTALEAAVPTPSGSMASVSMPETHSTTDAVSTVAQDNEQQPPLSSQAEEHLQADPTMSTMDHSKSEETSAGGEARQKSLVEQHLEKLMKKEKAERKREKRRAKKREKKRRKKEARKKKKQKEKKRKKKKRSSSSSSSESSSDSSSSDSSSSESEDEDAAREKRIKEAMKRQAEQEREVDRIMAMDERKRPYNLTHDYKEPTEEEMEAFRRKKVRTDDPMAQFLNRY